MLAHVSFVGHKSCFGQTDGRTDGQTDRHLLVASPRWHSMQRGKKNKKS